jgi:ferredoxin
MEETQMPSTTVSLSATTDPELCQGHGRCYRLAPAVFEADERGWGRVKLPIVGPEFAAAAQKAAKLCPELAVRVEPAS